MGAIASQITSLTIVYSTVYSDADQRNIKPPRHWPLCGEFTGDSPHKRPVTREMFPFDIVIMEALLVQFVTLQNCKSKLTPNNLNWICLLALTRKVSANISILVPVYKFEG